MLQTARTAGAAALLWIYWAKLMRDLHTCVSSALCGAPFYTAETHAKKNPFLWDDFYNSTVIAQELTGLLWLLQNRRGLRKMKRGREIPSAKRFCSQCHLQQLPALGRASLWAGTEGCVTGEKALPGPFSCHIPEHRHGPSVGGRGAAGAHCESWPSWQGNSSLAAQSFPLPQHCGKSPAQLSAESWSLTSLQNRRSWQRDFFIFLFLLLNSSHDCSFENWEKPRFTQAPARPSEVIELNCLSP